MTLKIICEVKDNKVTLTLPADFSHDGKVTVLVNDGAESNSKKMELMKSAPLDALFQADISEIQDDFNAIDSESLKP